MKLQTRFLRPSFFSSDKIAGLPPLTRLFFMGLWCVADREGRIEDRPARLKVLILPYDEFDAEIGLRELETGHHIFRYNVNAVSCIWIRAWETHGSPHNYEVESCLPAPQTSEENANDFKHDTSKDPSLSLAKPLARRKLQYRYRDKDTYKYRDRNKKIIGEDFSLPEPGDAVQRIFSAYLKSWNRTDRYNLTPERRKMIESALASKGEELCLVAVENFRRDEYERRTEFNDIEYLFGGTEKNRQKRVDRWCRRLESPATSRSRNEHDRDQDVLQTSLAMMGARDDEV